MAATSRQACCSNLRTTHLAPIEWRVEPRLALSGRRTAARTSTYRPPALIKGLPALRPKVLGAPAWDPDFNTADLPMLLRIDDLPSRLPQALPSAPDAPGPSLAFAGICRLIRAGERVHRALFVRPVDLDLDDRADSQRRASSRP